MPKTPKTPQRPSDDDAVALQLDGQHVTLTKARAFGMLDELLRNDPSLARVQARAYPLWRILEMLSPVIAEWANEWEHQTHD